MIFRPLALAMAFATFVSSGAKELTKVNISIQPAYHAIPIWAAKHFGWFEELGLEVELSIVSCTSQFASLPS
jgi:ABC-type nitrate/sulfonate/bicarbonate transport system substrate-binding protein